MKLWGWMLAAVLTATGLAATPAAAQPDRGRAYYGDDRGGRYGDDRGWRRDDYRRYKWNSSRRKWGNSRDKWDNSRRKWGWRSNCYNQWRDGRRERVCRRIHYRTW